MARSSLRRPIFHCAVNLSLFGHSPVPQGRTDDGTVDASLVAAAN
jgi:hypothetical protein